MEKDIVEKEVQILLKKFATALKAVDSKDEYYVDREIFEREEGEGHCDVDFKKKFLNNAPQHNDDFILAEKGDWK
jgi:predicted Asp-tRNA(Asn)/Glu-tRNA(Gln) amidotransferase subunit C